MARIFLDGTEQHFKDWSMWIGKNKELLLQVIYPSGRKDIRPFSEWQVEPTVERCERFIYNRQDGSYSEISNALEIGEKYYFITYLSNKKSYLYGHDKIELCMRANIVNDEKFNYFKQVAEYRKNQEKGKEDKNNGQLIFKQFNTIIPAKGTALNAYLTKELQKCQAPTDLIYPFGINETQLNAVKS